MADSIKTTRVRFWLWLIRLLGVIVPSRLRADWRHEWEAELRYRESLLADWERLNWRMEKRWSKVARSKPKLASTTCRPLIEVANTC